MNTVTGTWLIVNAKMFYPATTYFNIFARALANNPL